MIIRCITALALLALASISVRAAPPLDLQRDMGAACDGVADDTAAFHAWLAAGSDRLLTAGPGRCRITMQPPVQGFPLNIVGSGIDRTTFVREFAGTQGLGLITLRENSRGSSLTGFSIIAAAGTTGGHGIVIASTAGYTNGNIRVEDVKVSADGVNAWQTAVRLDGTARTTEPRGVRAVTFSGVHIFGASFVSLELAGVVGFTMNGGGLYAASGSSRYSGGLQIRGSAAAPSQYVTIDVSNVGVLNLSDVLGARIAATDIGVGNGYVIETAGSAINVAVFGKTWPGSGIPNQGVMSNWSQSSLTLPWGQVVN